MPSSSDNEDIDLFIESILQRDTSVKPDTDKQTFKSTINESQGSESFTSHRLDDKSEEEKNNNQSEALPKFQQELSKKGRNRPKDYLKNMYNNSLKYIVKRYISKTYQQKVQKIHQKIGIIDSQQAKNYYRIRQEETIGLTNLCDLLNFQVGSHRQRMYKKAFRTFYVWFMKHRYPIHILETGKLQHADVYWKAKNILIYLPQIKQKDNQQPSEKFTLGNKAVQCKK